MGVGTRRFVGSGVASLRRNPDFLRYWLGRAAGQTAASIVAMALPTLAILEFGAKAYQVGILQGLQFAAFPIFGLIIGAWVDRLRRRKAMMVADGLRMALIGAIAVALALHVRSLVWLYAAALGLGLLAVIFDVAARAYVPDLLHGRNLDEANAKLETSGALAQAAGNIVSGAIASLLGPLAALAAGGLAFAGSIAGVAAVKQPESAPAALNGSASFLRDVWFGIRFVAESRCLRAIALCNVTSNFGAAMVYALFLLFVYRHLRIAPAAVGAVLAFANVGSLGALFATRASRAFGLRTTMQAAAALAGVALAIPPLGLIVAPLPALIIGQIAFTAFSPVYAVTMNALRQSITPSELQGRMNATMSCVTCAALAAGSLAGGVLGGVAGVVPAILVGASVAAGGAFWLAVLLPARVALPEPQAATTQ